MSLWIPEASEYSSRVLLLSLAFLKDYVQVLSYEATHHSQFSLFSQKQLDRTSAMLSKLTLSPTSLLSPTKPQSPWPSDPEQTQGYISSSNPEHRVHTRLDLTFWLRVQGKHMAKPQTTGWTNGFSPEISSVKNESDTSTLKLQSGRESRPTRWYFA